MAAIRFVDVRIGESLPALAVAVTPSVIVAGALASGDFEVVHHDVPGARARGTPDIFMNILTTNGYVQRFVNDWAGPGARIRSVAIRLGVPNFAGDTLKLSGVVREKRTEGVSLITQSVFTLGVALWAVYGALLNNRPILYGNVVTLGFALAILILKIRFP
jgi:acyl dehydratase